MRTCFTVHPLILIFFHLILLFFLFFFFIIFFFSSSSSSSSPPPPPSHPPHLPPPLLLLLLLLLLILLLLLLFLLLLLLLLLLLRWHYSPKRTFVSLVASPSQFCFLTSFSLNTNTVNRNVLGGLEDDIDGHLSMTLIFTYLPTPWSRVVLEKLTGFAANQEIHRILWIYIMRLFYVCCAVKRQKCSMKCCEFWHTEYVKCPVESGSYSTAFIDFFGLW